MCGEEVGRVFSHVIVNRVERIQGEFYAIASRATKRLCLKCAGKVTISEVEDGRG